MSNLSSNNSDQKTPTICWPSFKIEKFNQSDDPCIIILGDDIIIGTYLSYLEWLFKNNVLRSLNF